MKDKFKILLFFIVIMATGCSANYNLNINEDNSISEKVIASENTNRINSLTKQKGDQAISYLFNMYNKRDDDIKYITNTDDKNTVVTATANYNDIEEYASKFKSDVFEKVYIRRKDNKVSFVANQSKALSNNGIDTLIYDDITVNITIPFKVTDNNADSVSGNVYTWKIKNDGELKTIEFTYEENSYKDNLNIKINNKMYNINYGIIAASGIILLIMIITLSIYVKNKKNNVV